jgi:hypothetical protein
MSQLHQPTIDEQVDLGQDSVDVDWPPHRARKPGPRRPGSAFVGHLYFVDWSDASLTGVYLVGILEASPSTCSFDSAPNGEAIRTEVTP